MGSEEKDENDPDDLPRTQAECLNRMVEVNKAVKEVSTRALPSVARGLAVICWSTLLFLSLATKQSWGLI